jgi:hypothetical protein
MASSKVILDVGGDEYTTSIDTLTAREQGTFLRIFLHDNGKRNGIPRMKVFLLIAMVNSLHIFLNIYELVQFQIM